MLRSFLYSLTYCIKEVIKGKIVLRLNEKVSVYETAMAWNRGIPCNFFKTMIQLFYWFFYILLTVSKRVSKAIFLETNWKSVGHWSRYRLKQRTPLQNIKISNLIVFFFVPWFIVLLNVPKRLLEVRSFDITWIWWHVRQIQPETGESIVFFSKH